MLKDIREMFRDERFLSKTWKIALPVTLQSLLNTLTNLIDTIMIGSLGEASIAGVGFANKVFFVTSLFVFGVGSGVSILVSQYWGNNDLKNVKRVFGFGLLVGTVFAVVMGAWSFIDPGSPLSIYTSEKDALRIGSEYLRISCFTFPLFAMSTTLTSLLRSTRFAKIPVLASVLSIVTNVFFNNALIFGRMGFPQLGVRGAAIATVIARIVEMGFIYSSVYAFKLPIRWKVRELFGFSKDFSRQFAKTSIPVMINEFLWGLGMAVYTAVYGHMGQSAAATMVIVGTYQDLEYIAGMGVASACLVILGNELGADKVDDAKIHARYYLILSVMIGIIVSVFTVFIAPAFISLYEVTPESAESIRKCLLIFAVVLTMRMYNVMLICGVLRSGGDTKMCAVIDNTGGWFIGVPWAIITGLVLKLPITVVFLADHVGEFYKTIFGTIRYRSFKWVRNLTVELTEKHEK